MSDNIIKLLNLKDSDLVFEDVSISKGIKTIVLSKQLSFSFCPICAARMHSKGIYIRTVNHPVLQDGCQLVLKLKQRRWKCTNTLCGHTSNDEFSFVDPGRRNTNMTDFSIVMAFKDSQLSAAQIARMFSVSDTYAITTFSRFVDMPRRHLTEAISIDEVHLKISKVCNYALVIQDFETGEPIDMIANRRQDITEPYFASIPTAERNRVRYLISDMYRPYIAYVDKYFPNAVSVVDSFHVVKMINGHILNYLRRLQSRYNQLDERRHDSLEQRLGRRIEFTHSREYYLIKEFKWLILKNQSDIQYSGKPRWNRRLNRYITIGELEDMLFDLDPDLRSIRNLKERYIRFNRDYGGSYSKAKVELRKLIQIYRDCPFRMFHEIADTLTYHFDSIANSFIMIERMRSDGIHVSRLSNGPMEALNRIAKDMKRNAHGYRNFEHARNRFLFSQRRNASILAVPKPMEETVPPTGIKRGPYRKP